jgi:hypothetical protein
MSDSVCVFFLRVPETRLLMAKCYLSRKVTFDQSPTQAFVMLITVHLREIFSARVERSRFKD